MIIVRLLVITRNSRHRLINYKASSRINRGRQASGLSNRLSDQMSLSSQKRPMAAADNKSNASIPWSTRNKSESTKSNKAPASPSPSSSIILVSPINKVLLLHRVQTSSSFPSAHVFPGGNLEPSDGELAAGDTNPARHEDSIAYRTGAIRELFEESGILLARESSAPDAPLLTLPLSTRLEGRKAIHSNSISITSWLAKQSSTAVLDTQALLPFTRWITPTNVPKRFTTQMYLYFLPVAAIDNPSLIATSDEIETMAPEWMYPYEWLDSARRNEIILFPPQFILLSFVSDFLDPSFYDTTITKSEHMSSDELEWRRRKLIEFVTKDGTPVVWRDKVISPTALSFTRKDGRTVLGLDKPGPELREASGVKGDDTRVVLVRFSKQGPRDVEVMMKKTALEQERREREIEAEAEAEAQAQAQAEKQAQTEAETAAADSSSSSENNQPVGVDSDADRNSSAKSKL